MAQIRSVTAMAVMEHPIRERGWDWTADDDRAGATDSPTTTLVSFDLISNDARGRGPRARRPLATFVAHLIAMDQRLPQARLRRRAEPEDAIAAYRARPTPPSAGKSLRQSL